MRPSKFSAVATASWPVRPSTTSSVSRGFVASRTAATSAISSSSIDRRPAVSSMKTSYPPSVACCFARLAICTGVCPGTIGSTSTPTCMPSTASCSIAAGRRVSRLAISTRLPSRSFRRLASFAVVVVLPEPCRPTIRIGAGGLSIFRPSAFWSPASTRTSSSWTILTTCWPGVTDFVTAWPLAFSVTALTKSRATGSDTSASSSATRTSRSAMETSSSLSAPALVSLPKTPDSRSDRFSNMGLPSRAPDPKTRNAPVGATR